MLLHSLSEQTAFRYAADMPCIIKRANEIDQKAKVAIASDVLGDVNLLRVITVATKCPSLTDETRYH
jgi:hypothetical protein